MCGAGCARAVPRRPVLGLVLIAVGDYDDAALSLRASDRIAASEERASGYSKDPSQVAPVKALARTTFTAATKGFSFPSIYKQR